MSRRQSVRRCEGAETTEPEHGSEGDFAQAGRTKVSDVSLGSPAVCVVGSPLSRNPCRMQRAATGVGLRLRGELLLAVDENGDVGLVG